MTRLNTYTGFWSIITRWIDKLAAARRREERQQARARELASAKERIRRENAGAGFEEWQSRKRAK